MHQLIRYHSTPLTCSLLHDGYNPPNFQGRLLLRTHLMEAMQARATISQKITPEAICIVVQHDITDHSFGTERVPCEQRLPTACHQPGSRAAFG